MGSYRIALAVMFCASPVFSSSSRQCAPCHPRQVAGFRQTGMGNSISRVTAQPSGRFAHQPSLTTFTVRGTAVGMTQQLARDGLTASHRVAYAIGSGNAAFGFLVR